jgi:hypothetical protein
MRVISAERGGTLRETAAMSRVYQEARQRRGAMAILEAKATAAEVDDYNVFVMTVAEAAARAHKEGGFLGIGGTPISDAENQALDEISSALGAPPAQAGT